MRTLLLLGVAAGSLLLTGRTAAAETPMTDSRAPTVLAQSAAFNPDEPPMLDYGTPAAPDARVYTGHPDRVPSEVDYRRVEGTYEAEGRWTGTWDGTYVAPDGSRYDGRYEGTVEGVGADYPPPPAYDPYYDGNYRGGYDPRYDAEMERRCGRGGTVGGAVVGGVIGGIAGNRIAGRGDRTAGTLIGGGLGALAGAAIGSADDRERCEAWWASRSSYRQGGYYPGPGYYSGGSWHHGASSAYRHGGYGYGYGYGYGWYSPGYVVTTIITTGAPVVTETVETTTSYVDVPVRKRHVPKKRKRSWKPKPKPRCVC